MLGRALVPRKDATPATRASTAIASIGGPSVPVQLTNGIRDLMISFADQSQRRCRCPSAPGNLRVKPRRMCMKLWPSRP